MYDLYQPRNTVVTRLTRFVLYVSSTTTSELSSQRISTVIKRRQKQRLADAAKLAQKEALGDFSHLKNKKGEFIAQPLPQPTLPNLSVDDDDDISSLNTRVPPSTYTYTQDQYYYNSDQDYPPPMPAYNPYSTHQAQGHPQFNPSQQTLGYEDSLYNYPSPQQQVYDDTDSAANLPLGAAPVGQQSPYDRPGTAPPMGHDVYHGRVASPQQSPYESTPTGHINYDPHDIYQGRTAGNRRLSPAGYEAQDQPSLYSGNQSAQTLYETPPNPYGGFASYSPQAQNYSPHVQSRRS